MSICEASLHCTLLHSTIKVSYFYHFVKLNTFRYILLSPALATALRDGKLTLCYHFKELFTSSRQKVNSTFTTPRSIFLQFIFATLPPLSLKVLLFQHFDGTFWNILFGFDKPHTFYNLKEGFTLFADLRRLTL